MSKCGNKKNKIRHQLHNMTAEKQGNRTSEMNGQDLQVLDISDLDFTDTLRVEKLVKQLSQACEVAGFFLLKVSNHDEFGKKCVKMLEATRKVFTFLPAQSAYEKERLVNDCTSQYIFKGQPIAGSGSGLRPIGQDPNFVADLRESFNMTFPDVKPETIQTPSYTGNGINKWPDPAWVGEDWKDVITEYADGCMKACMILARLFALALGMEMNYFERPGFFDNPTCMLGMNHYHFPTAKLWQDESDPFGVKPHLDSGIFTLLLTDGTQGLERCINRKTVDELTTHSERIWMPVNSPKPEEGLLIVNLGKNMDFWTGGRFKATLHRVVNKTQTARYSVPFFYEPNLDAVIEPLINSQDPVKNMQMKQYIEKKFGRSYIIPADLYFERLAERNNKNFDP